MFLCQAFLRRQATQKVCKFIVIFTTLEGIQALPSLNIKFSGTVPPKVSASAAAQPMFHALTPTPLCPTTNKTRSAYNPLVVPVMSRKQTYLWYLQLWSMLERCPNQYSLLYLTVCSNLGNAVASLIFSLVTLPLQEMPKMPRCHLWCAASFYFHLDAETGHSSELCSKLRDSTLKRRLKTHFFFAKSGLKQAYISLFTL